MSSYCKFYKQKQQVSYDEGTNWTDTGNYRQGELIERDSSDCGYVPPAPDPIYRWVDSGTTCVGGDKYNQQVKEVSYDNGSTWEATSETRTGSLIERDSSDCFIYEWFDNPSFGICDECPAPSSRTISTATTCIAYNKYAVNEYQVSYDGQNWITVSSSTGNLIESPSTDCGYPSSYSNRYLSFIALEDTEYEFHSYVGLGSTLKYSLDYGQNWNTITITSPAQALPVSRGETVLWKGNLFSDSVGNSVGVFTSTGRFNVEGNILSLSFGDNFTNGAFYSDYIYRGLFKGNTGVVSAEHMIFPSYALKRECFRNMFSGCTSLTTAPSSLPAGFSNGVSDECYERMFAGCTALTTPPTTLYASTSAIYAYNSMFAGCTSLTTAPVLPSASAGSGCYYNMFGGCTNLNHIECLLENPSSSVTYDWVSGVSPTGSFIKKEGANWSTGNNGIPTGWTTYPIARWVDSGYTCSDGNKYVEQIKEITYDGESWQPTSVTRLGSLVEENSYNCGYRDRITSGEPYCSIFDKYVDVYSQKSVDSGDTWVTTATTPTLVEANSVDCGYDPYISQPLTFVAVDSGTFSFSGSSSGSVNNSSILYSLDSGETWNSLGRNVASPTVQAGQKIMWEVPSSGMIKPAGAYSIGRFNATGRFSIEGNAMSLVYDDFDSRISFDTYGYNCVFYGLFKGNANIISVENLVLPATTLTDKCYCQMFSGCTSLTTAPKKLPAETLTTECYNAMFKGCTTLTNSPAIYATTAASGCCKDMFYDCSSLTSAPELLVTTINDECFYQMFKNCTSLTTAPSALPATSVFLGDHCYYAMFEGCTALTTPPELPATRLGIDCYNCMFRSCTSLTTAPVLPADELNTRSYNAMFSGCTNLNYVKCLATKISASYCLRNWLNSVSSSGTFVKASSMSNWPSGASGIPSNWTIENAT